MDREESRRLTFKIPELRKKELRSKLTTLEQQELNKATAVMAETYPNRTTQQYADRVRLMAIRNFTIIDTTRKESFFQKLFKQEHNKEYRLHFLNEEEDVAEYTIPFTFGLEIRQLMDDVGLGLDGRKCCQSMTACPIQIHWKRMTSNGLKLSRNLLGARPN